MAIITRIYVFDVKGFREYMGPLIDDIHSGNYEVLAAAATNVARDNPQVWTLLQGFRFHPTDLGSEVTEFPEAQDRVRFWLMILISPFLQPMERQSDQLSSPSLRGFNFVEKLKSDGWNEEDAKRLNIGNPVKVLLGTGIGSSLSRDAQNAESSSVDIELGQLPNLTGWLSSDEVLEFLDKIRDARARETAGHGSPDSALSALYNQLDETLGTAAASGMGLFTAVTM
jgi:hypothetical protein